MGDININDLTDEEINDYWKSLVSGDTDQDVKELCDSILGDEDYDDISDCKPLTTNTKAEWWDLVMRDYSF